MERSGGQSLYGLDSTVCLYQAANIKGGSFTADSYLFVSIHIAGTVTTPQNLHVCRTQY